MSVSPARKSSPAQARKLSGKQLQPSRKFRRALFLESLEARQVMAGSVLATPVGPLLMLSNAAGGDPEEIQISLAGGNYVITGLNGTLVNGAASDSFADAAIDQIVVAAGFTLDHVELSTAINPADTAFISTIKLTLGDAAAHVVSLTSDDALGYDGNTDGNITFNDVAEFAVGANASDELRTYNTQTDWTINETTGSSLKAATSTLKFSGFEKLTGGTAADDFVVADAGAVLFTLAGGAGTDTLNVTGLAAPTVTVTNDGAPAGFDGTVGATSFTSIDSFQGAAGSTFVGDDAPSSWTINDGGTSTYATAARTANIAGVNNLQGGSAQDVFSILNNSATNNYSLKGGAGIDVFNFGQANSLANITQPISVDGEANGGALALNDQGVGTNVNYTAAANTIGRDAGGTVTYSNVTDLTLNATNGTNTIKITAVPTATGTKSFNGGTGDDTLDTSGLAANVVVNAPNATKGFDGTVTGAGSFTGIEFFKGNNASAFLGDDEISTWTINDTTGSTYVSQSRTASISGFSVLQGGSKVDTFNVQDNSGALAYTLNGGAGLDAFNFGAANSLVAISKNIAVNGEADSATLTLHDQGVATNLNYTLGANTIGRDTGGTVTYSAITDLTLNASNGSNTIKITAVPTAIGTKTLNGGTGDDSLDLTALATTDVTLTAANATKGFNGTVTGVANFTGVEEIKGNGVGDLTGLNEDATWTINDGTGHTYVALSKTLKFSGFDNLNGGSKVDTYKVQNNAASNTFTLDGKAGGDKFLIGDTVNKLVGLKNLSVIGNADVGDELTLNDQAEAGASDYNLTSTTATDVGGVVVSHNTVEKITLNASAGANTITVFDGAYNPATTIKLVDTAGASTLGVDDTADAGANTWTMSSSQVNRTAPVHSLSIDYSSQATITNLTFAGGSGIDNVTVSSTKVATSVSGNDGNDVFSVGGGDLDNFLGQLTINGGTHNLADARTVFKGGAIPGPADIVFNASSTAVAKGDTLTVSDNLQAGVTKYAVNNTTVSRTGAAKSVTYSNIELLNVVAGSGDSDVLINLPTAAPVLPFVVSIDGGGGADNRVQIKGTDAVDAITVGNSTGVETNRSQFEVTSVTRLWVEGGKNADVIHNRSTVPGLLDGGYAKSTATIDAGNQNDVIASDAPSTTTFSPVLLGNDGLDFLYTTNGATAGTTYLVGDYFVNNNVPLVSGSASKTSRLQVVAGPGQAGDRYVTNHTPAVNLRNRVLARLDTAANSYSGRFANLTADTIGNTLGVIEWLRGRLPLTVTSAGMAGELSRINFYIRQFTREPGSVAAPVFPNATYNPGGVASGGSFNGGEFVDEEALEPTPLIQNPFDAGDVNGDGRVTAFDAIIIINELNRHGARPLDTSATGEFGVNGGGAANRPLNFLDVNGDSSISAFDAILIINRLNTVGTSGYQLPTPLDWFLKADAAEQTSADFAASQPVGLPNSLSDEALLALLAAGENDDES